jgi:hypothetical protein
MTVIPDQPAVPWVTAAQVGQFEQYKAAVGSAGAAAVTTACAAASSWLWRATGRQFGGIVAGEVVRPVSRWHSVAPRGPHTNDPSYTTTFDPSFFTSRTGQYGWPTSQGRQEWAWEMMLGNYPVVSVDEIVIDGSVFPAINSVVGGPLFGLPNYRLDDSRWVTRCDGGAWPWWQDWRLPSAANVAPGQQQGTWQITYTWGIAPPQDGVYAAAVLSGELLLAVTDAPQARLNPRIQSMARQGESMLLVDPQMLLQGQRWGLREIDMFVEAINPNKLMQPTLVVSPDLPRSVRRAGT